MNDNAKILIVDDELPVCKSIAGALVGHNYIIDMALSGEEALKKNEEKQYDVIITDLMMPGMSGMDLLKMIHDKRPGTAIIMITGYPSIKSAVQSIKLGAFDFIPKPFTPNELRSLVSRAMETKYLHEQEQTREKGDETADIIIPEGLYCITDNSWVKIENDGTVRIGVHHILPKTIEKIASVEFPKENEMRYQGEACVAITDSRKNMYRVWTPVSGRIITVNEAVRKDYSKLVKDPYGEGWILLMTPTHLEEEIKSLDVLKSS